jgi:hypothetical protein
VRSPARARAARAHSAPRRARKRDARGGRRAGIIITQHAQLSHYLGMLTHQAPIESKFIDNLTDNLNAEIVLGAPAPRPKP